MSISHVRIILMLYLCFLPAYGLNEETCASQPPHWNLPLNSKIALWKAPGRMNHGNQNDQIIINEEHYCLHLLKSCFGKEKYAINVSMQ